MSGSSRRDLAWPFGIVAGLGLVVATNIVMVHIALGHRSAPVSDDPWGDALRHDEQRAEREASRGLGWSASVKPHTRIEIVVRDAQQRPLEGLDARVVARRSDSAQFDRSLTLTSVGDGIYRAADTLPAHGLYDLEIRLRSPAGDAWVENRRLLLRGIP